MTQASNMPSAALTLQQNERLFKLLGSRSSTLASAVTQVFLADSTSKDRWNKKFCGIACFVKDNSKRSYFIRVLDLQSGNVIWEQEVYNQFKYHCLRPFFHTFEADECMAGLNFSDDNDATNFENTINTKLAARAAARSRKKPPKKKPDVSFPVPELPTGLAPERQEGITGHSSPALSAPIEAAKASQKQSKKKDKNNSKKGAKFTKAMISQPTEFRHVNHIGWDPTKGVDIDNVDPDVKDLLDVVGITPNELQDKENATFVNNFIEQNGGVEAIKKRCSMEPTAHRGKASPEGRPLPQAPERRPRKQQPSMSSVGPNKGAGGLSHKPSSGTSSQRQVRPVRSGRSPSRSPRPVSRGLAPPPPPPKVKIPGPPPPPPPPLPPMGLSSTGTSSPMGSTSAARNPIGGDVLDGLDRPIKKKAASLDGHQSLMAQLNVDNRKTLKRVDTTAVVDRPPPEDDPDDIENALKRAVKERYDKMKDDDFDEEDFENVDDDEWD